MAGSIRACAATVTEPLAPRVGLARHARGRMRHPVAPSGPRRNAQEQCQQQHQQPDPQGARRGEPSALRRRPGRLFSWNCHRGQKKDEEFEPFSWPLPGAKRQRSPGCVSRLLRPLHRGRPRPVVPPAAGPQCSDGLAATLRSAGEDVLRDRLQPPTTTAPWRSGRCRRLDRAAV